MPLDILPAVIAVPSQDDIIDQTKTDMRFFGPPGLNTSDGTLPDTDARTLAAQLVPIWAATKIAGDNLVVTEAQGAALDAWCTAAGIPTHLPAIGAVGYVVAGAGFSSGGSTIFSGDELTYKGIRYQVTTTGTYFQGSLVPVSGVDVGLGTDQPPGTALVWTSPRPGCEPISLVWTAADGTGLTGGRDIESDQDCLQRYLTSQREPAASGNDAAYQRAAEATPGVPIEKAFTYPAILGPGTTALCFTVRQDTPTSSRIPSSAQIAAVGAYVAGQFPADDGLFMCSLSAQPVNVALRVDWRAGATGWADATPWPLWTGAGTQFTVSAVTSATVFTVTGGATAPAAGNTIAIYSIASGLFYRKKVQSVSGAGPWVITCNTTANASDTSFTPPVGSIVSPWSDSLNSIPPAVLAYFATLGPGEQVSSFFDPGLRQKRSPASPGDWPAVVGNRVVTAVQNVPAVFDGTLVNPTIPLASNVGPSAVFSYLMRLNQLSIYPLSM